jgi:hypothetical protein
VRAYKVTLLILDHEDLGEDRICDVLTGTRYPNHCIGPEVLSIRSAEIGEWHDDHPLSVVDSMQARLMIRRIFRGVKPPRGQMLRFIPGGEE